MRMLIRGFGTLLIGGSTPLQDTLLRNGAEFSDTIPLRMIIIAGYTRIGKMTMELAQSIYISLRLNSTTTRLLKSWSDNYQSKLNAQDELQGKDFFVATGTSHLKAACLILHGLKD